MSKDFLHIKKIDDYLSGNLSLEGKSDFEQQLKIDINLQEEVRIIELVIKGIEGYGFKEMIKEIHEKNFGKLNPPKIN